MDNLLKHPTLGPNNLKKVLFLQGGHTHWVQSVTFSSDGKQLLTSSEDSTLKIWDISTMKCMYTLEGHKGSIYSASFSNNNKSIVSCGYDCSINLWDLDSQKCIFNFQGHTYWINTVEFSPDDQYVVSGCQGHTIKIWNINSKDCIATLNGHVGQIQSATFSPDCTKIASCSSDKTIKIWDFATKQCIHTIDGHLGWVRCVVFTHDGTNIISGNDEKTIKIHDVDSAECIYIFYGHTSAVFTLSLSYDQKKMVSGSRDGVIKIWDFQSKQCLQSIQAYQSEINSISFSIDNKTVASCSTESTIKLLNINTMEVNSLLSDICKGTEKCVHLFPKQQKLITFCNDGSLKLLSTSSGRVIEEKKLNQKFFKCFYPSNDGTIAAIISQEKEILILDLFTFDFVSYKGEFINYPTTICLSQNNELLAISFSQESQIWDIKSRKLIQQIQENELNHSLKMEISQNNKVMIKKDSQFIKLWDINKEKLIKTISQKDQILMDLRNKQLSIEQLKSFFSYTITTCQQKLIIMKDFQFIEVWSLKTMKIICRRRNVNHNIVENFNNKLLTGGINTNMISLWKLQSPKPLIEKRIEDLKGINCIQVNNGNFVFCNDQQQLVIYEYGNILN